MTLAGAPGTDHSILEQSIRRALHEPPPAPSGARICRF
jgi:hypothetical protein